VAWAYFHITCNATRQKARLLVFRIKWRLLALRPKGVIGPDLDDTCIVDTQKIRL
jgi:hypothetical protein